MSHDPSDDIYPQPGAVTGLYQIRVYAEDIEAAGWPTLPAAHAVNFAYGSLMPVRIKKPVWVEPKDKDAWRIEDPDTGQLIDTKRLYRVWGAWSVRYPNWAAWDTGRYWTDEEPQSEDDFYGKAAVMLEWNSGRYLAQLVEIAEIPEIRAWMGTTAPQPADGMDESGRPTGPLPDYHLPGGDTVFHSTCATVYRR